MSMNGSYCIFRVSWDAMQAISTSEFSKSDLRSYQSPVMCHKLQVPSLLCPNSTATTTTTTLLSLQMPFFKVILSYQTCYCTDD